MKNEDTKDIAALSWQQRYQALEKTLREADTAAAQSISQPERRSMPRQNFQTSKRLFIQSLPQEYEVIDISPLGVSFFAANHFAPKTKLVLSAMNLIALEVEVLNCTMEANQQDNLEYRYRVRGRFGPDVNGNQVAVLAYEMSVRT